MSLLWLRNKLFHNPRGDIKIKSLVQWVSRVAWNKFDWHGERVTGHWLLKGKEFTLPQRGKSTACGAWGPINLSVLLRFDPQWELLMTDWLLLHLMKSPFWVSLKAGHMIYSYLTWFPELSNNHLVVLTHIQKVWISAAPSGPMIRASATPESLLLLQIHRHHPNLLNRCFLGMESQDSAF